MKFFICFLSAALILSACKNDNKSKTGNDSKDKADSAAKKTETKTKDESVNSKGVLNNIHITTNGGVKVNRAYLALEDGSLILDDNTVGIGQKAVLHLNVEGWKVDNGKTFLGAYEKIATNSGEKVLEADDLFQSYTDGIDPNDAKSITLSAVITKNDPNYDHFVVSFRVWDKKDNGEISGSYKLYIK